MTVIMSTFLQMFLIVSFLSGTLADVDTCVDQNCAQTKPVKANETQSITLFPCDGCKAKDCVGRQIIHEAWWSLNRSQIYSHQASATERSYSIDLDADLVPQGSALTIYTTYTYSCSESNRYHELHDINVTVIPVSAPNLSCQSSNNNTVSEGSPIVLLCHTQLSDSREVKTVFHFGDRHRSCEADAYGDDSKWVVSRTKDIPYDCQLNVTSAQLADAGKYTCGVDIPDEELKSNQLQIEISPSPTSNPVTLILETAVPGGILILVVVFILLSTLIWLVIQNRRQGHRLNDLRQRLDRLEAHPQPVVPLDNRDIEGSRESDPPRHAGLAPNDLLSLHPALQHSPVPSSHGSGSSRSLEAAEVGNGEKTHLVSSPRPKRWIGGGGFSSLVSSHPSLHLHESGVAQYSDSPTAWCDSISREEHQHNGPRINVPARRENEQPVTYGTTKVTN